MKICDRDEVTSDGSWPKVFDPDKVGSIFCGLGVSHLWIGSGFGKFPLKCQIFQFFCLRVKKNLIGSTSYLVRVKSELRSSQVKAHL